MAWRTRSRRGRRTGPRHTRGGKVSGTVNQERIEEGGKVSGTVNQERIETVPDTFPPPRSCQQRGPRRHAQWPGVLGPAGGGEQGQGTRGVERCQEPLIKNVLKRVERCQEPLIKNVLKRFLTPFHL